VFDAVDTAQEDHTTMAVINGSRSGFPTSGPVPDTISMVEVVSH
jgi:hypothetical protein